MPDEHGWDQGLSPTEQLILQYIGEGLRDAEIAVRLAIPTGDAKERVARLVEKLGVQDRAALVEAQQAPAVGRGRGPRRGFRRLRLRTSSPMLSRPGMNTPRGHDFRGASATRGSCS